MIGKFLKPRWQQTGDTIIEVMAAIAILGMAMGAAYVLSSRAFHTAQNTDERSEALALAQGQIEFLRNAGLEGRIGALPAGSFCFNDGNGQTASATSDTCRTYNNTVYNLSISYSANIYTVQTTWTEIGGGLQNNVTLYYKPQS